MREKLYNVLNKIYGILMTISFFAGAVPFLAFVVAIIIGGSTGEAISVFLDEYIYPYILAMASIAIVIGWIAMYVGKKEGLSVKSLGNKEIKNPEEETK